jgi:hypothetical protein
MSNTLLISLGSILGFGLMQAGVLNWIRQSDAHLGVQTALYVLSTLLFFALFIALVVVFREDQWVVFLVFFGYNILKICLGTWNALRHKA